LDNLTTDGRGFDFQILKISGKVTEMASATHEEKYKRVLEKNTFFFHHDPFEEKWEAYVASLTQSLLLLKQRVDSEGVTKEVFTKFLVEQPDGLKAILALLGFSDEMLYRLVTFIRGTNDPQLNKLINKSEWPPDNFKAEWKEDKIVTLLRGNPKIALGFVNLFFEGSTVPFVRNNLPLFEFKKLSLSKLNFTFEALLDTIIRLKVKGSYKAQTANNPESLLGILLTERKIKWASGNGFRKIVGRDMDVLIPDREKPLFLIECSYQQTTSSAMGDKAANEGAVAQKIKTKFRGAKFFGFVDGVGWYVRRSDMKVLVGAFDDVFTFHPTELVRFTEFLEKTLPKDCFVNE
jgi:hypothetical protein